MHNFVTITPKKFKKEKTIIENIEPRNKQKLEPKGSLHTEHLGGKNPHAILFSET